MQNTIPTAYLRTWKWCLAFESLIMAGLGFSFSLPCGISTLVIGAVINFIFYREIDRPAKNKRLVILWLTFAIVNSLCFCVSGVFPVILKYISTGASFGKAIRLISGVWPQVFVMILLFSIFNKALIFAIATSVQKTISNRASKNLS